MFLAAPLSLCDFCSGFQEAQIPVTKLKEDIQGKGKMNRVKKKREPTLMEELRKLDLLGEGEQVNIPALENEDLIEENSLSIVVRCLNPSAHKVGALVKALPSIWGMEDRVRGRGIGENKV